MQIFMSLALIASCLLASAMANEDDVLQDIKNLIEGALEQSGPHMGDGSVDKELPIGDGEQQATSQGINGGVTYTRWGKSSCPKIKGTKLVYSGITGGTFWSHAGGGANYLCMPKDPEYSPDLTYRPGSDVNIANGFASKVYGAEYEFPIQGTHETDVPCAVCYVFSRQAVLMIPAKYECPPSWTREYYGYLMTELQFGSTIRGPTMFECVDEDQEPLPGTEANLNGILFYHTEVAASGQFSFPPYSIDQELNCVVCTK